MTAIATSEIERINASAGYHLFDAETTRFFSSRISDTAYLSDDGTHAYFTTSEKGPNGIRAYSVRVADMATGTINTVGEFQAYYSRDLAIRSAQHHALMHGTQD